MITYTRQFENWQCPWSVACTGVDLQKPKALLKLTSFAGTFHGFYVKTLLEHIWIREVVDELLRLFEHVQINTTIHLILLLFRCVAVKSLHKILEKYLHACNYKI